MDLSRYDFALPPELIAQKPLEERAASRMLVLNRAAGSWEDRQFRELPQFIRPGDCLVLNDSRVFPSRLLAGRTEVLLLHPVSADRRDWAALVRPGRRLGVGEKVQFSDELAVEIVDRAELGERVVRLHCSSDIDAAIERTGHVPLPPYIKRPDEETDRERYQTVYARERGSAAAPTAGLHFTPEILDLCRRAGADVATVTLHVGLGTFAPLRERQVARGKLHEERYSIDSDQAARIRDAARRIAVGTTSVRALETAARAPSSRATDLFIQPGFEFRSTNALITNFHLPQSSLLILVCALAGTDFILAAYRHAIESRYRFYSYGDCMLIL